MTNAVCVIVLSYNCTTETLACLDSLLLAHGEVFGIIVVDNASTDGAAAAIRLRYPDIHLIELTENRGWAGGNNVGVQCALKQGAELICLLNNDTIIPSGTIAALAQAARAHAPCLMHPSIDYADVGQGAQLDPSDHGRFGRFTRVGNSGAIFDLGFAYGACLMVPAELFRRIGMFDERFYLQLEETDFWLRARRIGYRSLCSAQARIIHAESRSFGGKNTPMKTYYIVRNTLLLTEKHHRNLLGILRALRALYWTISQVVDRDEFISRRISPVAWPLSQNRFLVAARAGFRDYLLRRFGPISVSALRAINSASASVKEREEFNF